MSVRVAGTDPGTSSLDVVILDDCEVVDQIRFSPEQLSQDPQVVIDWLESRGPFDLVAAPSGYGLPLISSDDCTPKQRRLMSLVRPDDLQAKGVGGFSRLVDAFCRSSLPAVFLPGVIHLDSVPTHRKHNRIDMGTSDKLCVGALALHQRATQLQRDPEESSFCLVELGSAFTACLSIEKGKVVAGFGGSSGPIGWRSCGSWDGERAYLTAPLSKGSLFTGGVTCFPREDSWGEILVESVIMAVASLSAIVPTSEIVLSGRLLELEPDLVRNLERKLARWGPVVRLDNLQGAWVKHAAQGSALLADGLAGGKMSNLVKCMALRESQGTVLDWISPSVSFD